MAAEALGPGMDGGTPEEAPRPGWGAFLAMAALALGVQWALAAALFGLLPLPGGAPAALAAHVGLIGLLALWLRARRRRDLDLRLPGLLAVCTAFLGPLGPPAVLATALLHAIFRRYATGFHEWYLSLFPESEIAPAEELYELIVTGREQAGGTAVDSFTDVMTLGSPPQKQAVIALVARHFRPAFTPALKLGLADADPSVRVQAATATARVEHEFNQRWMRLDRAVQADPDDARAHHALARLLDHYAFCGLLDENREQELRRKALEGYREALALLPDDDDVRHDLGRLLLRLGLADEAARTLEPLIERTDDRRVLFWYAESLFRLGRYGELRALCGVGVERFGDQQAGAGGDAVADVIALWTGARCAPASGEAAA